MFEIRRREKKTFQLTWATWAPVFPPKKKWSPNILRHGRWRALAVHGPQRRLDGDLHLRQGPAQRRLAGNGFVGEKKIRTDLIMESYLSHLESRFPCVYLSMGFNVSICLSIYIMLAIYTYLFTPSSIYLHILVYNRLYRQFEQDCVDTSVVFPIASRSPLPPGPEARGPRRLSCS